MLECRVLVGNNSAVNCPILRENLESSRELRDKNSRTEHSGDDGEEGEEGDTKAAEFTGGQDGSCTRGEGNLFFSNIRYIRRVHRVGRV